MTQLKRFLLVAALGLSAACFPSKPPSLPGELPPTPRAVAIVVYNNVTDAPISGAVAELRDVDGTLVPCANECVSNPDGYVLWPSVTVGRAVVGKVSINTFSSVQWAWTITADFPDHRVGLAPLFVPLSALPRLHVSGTEFRTDANVRFTPIFASELSILRRSPTEQRERLKEVKALGFNGVRLFAGDVFSWAGQTPAMARAALGPFLDIANEEGIYVLVTALTGKGYDVVAHLYEIAAIAKARTNTLFECANEIDHSSQSDLAHDPEALYRECRAAVAGSIPWALGAATAFDEPTPNGTWPLPMGDFITVHLDRGRDPLNMARRVRELYAIKEVTGKPVWNSEPIGFDEVERPGSRTTDCSIAYALAVLNNGFGIAHLYHSQSGLMAEPFGPKQRECAVAFVKGATK